MRGVRRRNLEVTPAWLADPSLVLYLPLYELDGSTFASKDRYGHLCTNTGALWKPNGRQFVNGTDGIICGKNSTLIDVNTDLTIAIWVNPTNSTGTRDLINTRDVNNNNGMALEAANGSLAWTVYFYVGGFTGTVCNTSLIQGKSQCFMITKSGSAGLVTYFLDNVRLNNFTLGGAITASAGNFQVGGWRDNNVNGTNATIHEVAKWNRVLSNNERSRYYETTQARYQ